MTVIRLSAYEDGTAIVATDDDELILLTLANSHGSALCLTLHRSEAAQLTKALHHASRVTP